jgi:hypothetical protein
MVIVGSWLSFSAAGTAIRAEAIVHAGTVRTPWGDRPLTRRRNTEAAGIVALRHDSNM